MPALCLKTGLVVIRDSNHRFRERTRELDTPLAWATVYPLWPESPGNPIRNMAMAAAPAMEHISS